MGWIILWAFRLIISREELFELISWSVSQDPLRSLYFTSVKDILLAIKISKENYLIGS